MNMRASASAARAHPARSSDWPVERHDAVPSLGTLRYATKSQASRTLLCQLHQAEPLRPSIFRGIQCPLHGARSP